MLSLRALVTLCLLSLSIDPLLAVCLEVAPPIKQKRGTSSFRYQIDNYFLSDGANYQRPGFKSFQCIADGLEFWNNKGGVQVGPTPPSANVTVVRGPSSNQFSGSSITNGIVTTGGTITLPENISSQGDFNCDRIKKLAAHEMGHILGLDHLPFPHYSIMREATPYLPYNGIDDMPLGVTCGDESSVERAQYFVGPGPVAWSGIGGIIGCGPNEWTDDHGCCHEIGPLLFASAVGHLNRRPEIHFRANMPGQNQTFAPFSTINFAVHTLDSDGSVYRVDYHVSPVGGTPFIIYTAGYPFSMSASNVPPGTYDVRAVAYDTAQEYTMSEVRRVIVLPPAANTPNNLLSGASLGVNQYRISPNGLYTLVYQTDGNLVFYGPGSVPIVWTGTSGAPAGAYMNPSGNLEVYNAGPTLVWQSLTGGSGNAGSHLTVKDSGHIAIVRPNGTQVVQWP